MHNFPALQHMHIQCICGADVKLQYLTALLRAAPNLLIVTLPFAANAAVRVESSPQVLPDLVYLDAQLQGGLSTELKDEVEGELCGPIPIRIRCGIEVGTADSSIAEFLTSLPCLPALDSIHIAYTTTSSLPQSHDLQQVARACPNLCRLFLSGKLCDADLIPLAACAKLKMLLLMSTSVTPMGLAVLCCHLCTLPELVFIEPKHGTSTYGVSLTDLLISWRLTTKVCVTQSYV